MESPALVDGRGHTIEQLFGGRHYYLGHFQREFVWERAQIEKLVNDLSERFLEQWDRTHERTAVERYDTYYLGPIVSYDDEGKRYLVDGQQRFMTLLLLLIHIRRLLDAQGNEEPSVTMVDRVIARYGFGKQIFVLSVPEYNDCLDALYHGREFPIEKEIISVRRLVNGYRVIEEVFPQELHEALAYFADWLLNRVSMVEIQAGGKSRAWEVYQAMNDRGVQLTSMELLKGYLLDKSPEADRMSLRDRWQDMISKLDVDERKRAVEYIKTLVRAKYVPLDSDGALNQTAVGLVEEAVHEWIRFHLPEMLPSQRDGGCGRLISDVIVPFGVFYAQLLRAQLKPPKGWEAILFNHRNGIDRQFDLTLAAVNPEDSEDVRSAKVKLIAEFVDLLLVRSYVNNSVFRQEDLDAIVTRLVGGVRRASTIDELRKVLSKYLTQSLDFSGIRSLRLRDSNRTFVRYFLARLTAWLEVGVGHSDPILDYLAVTDDGPVYQIEHLFSASHAQYASEVPDANTFRTLRSRLGALVLLHRRDNASLKERHLDAKILAYKGKNYLAGSLHPATYGAGESRFRSFIKAQEIAELFRPYSGHISSYVEERGVLYHAIAERVWDPVLLGLEPLPSEEVEMETAVTPKRKKFTVDFQRLVLDGVIGPGTKLVGRRHNIEYVAVVEGDGRIRTSNGGSFPTPSAAAMDVLNVASANGWLFWSAEVDGHLVRLDALRTQHIARKDGGG